VKHGTVQAVLANAAQVRVTAQATAAVNDLSTYSLLLDEAVPYFSGAAISVVSAWKHPAHVLSTLQSVADDAATVLLCAARLIVDDDLFSGAKCRHARPGVVGGLASFANVFMRCTGKAGTELLLNAVLRTFLRVFPEDEQRFLLFCPERILRAFVHKLLSVARHLVKAAQKDETNKDLLEDVSAVVLQLTLRATFTATLSYSSDDDIKKYAAVNDSLSLKNLKNIVFCALGGGSVVTDGSPPAPLSHPTFLTLLFGIGYNLDVESLGVRDGPKWAHMAQMSLHLLADDGIFGGSIPRIQAEHIRKTIQNERQAKK
jgi:hypothetical protein